MHTPNHPYEWFLSKKWPARIVTDAYDMWGYQTIQFWNVGAEKLFSRSSADATEQPINQLLVATDNIDQKKLIAEVVAQGFWSGERVYKRQDGSEITVASRLTYRPVKDGRDGTLIEFPTDISQKKLGETRVREFYSTVSHELCTPLTSIAAH